MLLLNQNIKNLIGRALLVFALIALIEYVVILLLQSRPIIQFKAQAIILVSAIAFICHTGYKIWFIYDLDHPLSQNGEQHEDE